jgi:hypothetical protein
MCRCPLGEILNCNVQVLKLIVSEFFDDLSKKRYARMTVWQRFYFLELATR